MLKLWRLEQVENLAVDGLPEEVFREIKATLTLLNHCYGEHRDVDQDLGGYVALFTQTDEQQDYENLMKRYHLTKVDREYTERLCVDGDEIWKKEVFVCSSDYGIVVIRPDMEVQKERSETK